MNDSVHLKSDIVRLKDNIIGSKVVLSTWKTLLPIQKAVVLIWEI